MMKKGILLSVLYCATFAFEAQAHEKLKPHTILGENSCLTIVKFNASEDLGLMMGDCIKSVNKNTKKTPACIFSSLSHSEKAPQEFSMSCENLLNNIAVGKMPAKMGDAYKLDTKIFNDVRAALKNDTGNLAQSFVDGHDDWKQMLHRDLTKYKYSLKYTQQVNPDLKQIYQAIQVIPSTPAKGSGHS